MISPKDYFPRLDKFPHADLFAGVEPVWAALGRLEDYIRRVIAEADAPEGTDACLAGLRVEDGLAVSEGLVITERAFRIARAGLLIEAGVRIEPGVVIKGPTVLCAGAEIRHGAYFRGSCLIGPDAIVGHATEVKNSAFLNHAEAGHFAYVGDSLLGADSNLGAGTKLANLQFRTEAQKENGTPDIVIKIDGKLVDTGLRKFGAVIGEHVEIGCNTVTSPGTLIGPGCWVTPNTTVFKGVYPPSQLIRAAGGKPAVSPRK
jgi:bifunctional N-acetylglucosamine-1-phosphate-uridyltransferase/glucosamine-1-phosphate-acetyltransferase GlmU-like protein